MLSAMQQIGCDFKYGLFDCRLSFVKCFSFISSAHVLSEKMKGAKAFYSQSRLRLMTGWNLAVCTNIGA